MILAFPTMEFGGQEFSDDAEIQAFADKQDFPGVLMKLGNVLGSDAPKVWQYLKSETGAEDPDWNFQGKFLVDKEGKGRECMAYYYYAYQRTRLFDDSNLFLLFTPFQYLSQAMIWTATLRP